MEFVKTCLLCRITLKIRIRYVVQTYSKSLEGTSRSLSQNCLLSSFVLLISMLSNSRVFKSECIASPLSLINYQHQLLQPFLEPQQFSSNYYFYPPSQSGGLVDKGDGQDGFFGWQERSGRPRRVLIPAIAQGAIHPACLLGRQSSC